MSQEEYRLRAKFCLLGCDIVYSGEKYIDVSIDPAALILRLEMEVTRHRSPLDSNHSEYVPYLKGLTVLIVHANT
jgi:hypothetical protein